MSYFQRLRRPYIVVYPEVAAPNEGTEAQASPAKAEAPPPACAEQSERACTEHTERALTLSASPEVNSAEGRVPNKTKGRRAKPARPRRASPRRPPPRKLAARGAIESARPDLGRHERKCSVCCHPDRDAIEEAFVHWHSPFLIAQDYEISDDSVYRHAYATGLDAVRSRNLRCALERILEKAQRVIPTADSIVRAVRAYTRINDAGQWVEPPTHVIVSSGSAFHLDESRACPSLPAGEAGGRRASTVRSSPAIARPSRPNRGIPELENGSTR